MTNEWDFRNLMKNINCTNEVDETGAYYTE